MKYLVSSALVLALAGCAGQGPGFMRNIGAGQREAPPPVEAEAPQDGAGTEGDPLAGAVEAPEEEARTVEEFDTTSPEQRAAVLDETPPAAEGGRLGTTIGSLGDPTEPGFWVKTPYVTEPAQGRVVYAVSGRSVQVQLLPSGGAPGSGSQVSLAAMRLLDAPLAGLPELVLYVN